VCRVKNREKGELGGGGKKPNYVESVERGKERVLI
jgi:hypothetical protein